MTTYREQVQTLFIEVRYDTLEFLLRPSGECILIISQLSDTGPNLFTWRAEDPDRTVQRESTGHSDYARNYLKILKIWSISESPGNRGLPRITISAKMHPTDHISIAVE